MSISELKNRGYKKLKLTVSLDIAEIKDGYQYFMIYYGNNESTAICIGSKDIEHTRHKEDNNYKTYIFDIEIDINSIKSNNIYFLYGASGVGNDDWYNKNVKVEGTFTKIP